MANDNERNGEEKDPKDPALDPENLDELETDPELKPGDPGYVEPGNEGLEKEPGEEQIDFEERLRKERERLGGKIDDERKKRIEAERKKGISREEAEKIADEKVAGFRKEMSRERAVIIAERLAKSPAERDLILFHYDNSIVPSSNLEEDIEKAHALANRKQTAGTISELEKANLHKKTISSGGADGGQPPKVEPVKKYSQEILDGAKFAGCTPEEFVKRQQGGSPLQK